MCLLANAGTVIQTNHQRGRIQSHTSQYQTFFRGHPIDIEFNMLYM